MKRLALAAILLGCCAPEPVFANVDHALEAASVQTGVPLPLLRAVAWVESRFDAGARSPVGARGLLQLMPCILRTFHVSNPFDPRQNALAGAKFLRSLRSRFHRWRPALAAYNWGPGNVKASRGDWPTSVRKYVKTVCMRSGECS